MNSVTLAHTAEHCRDVAVNIIKQNPSGITARELLRLMPLARHKYKMYHLRELLDALEDDEIIESEQYKSNEKVYFLYGRTPRVRVYVVPAIAAPKFMVPPVGLPVSFVRAGAPC